MKLENRTILITGGTSGIGFELARQLIARRNTVIVTGRDPRKLQEAKSSLPAVQTIQSDASKAEEIDALFRQVTAQFPACDTLFVKRRHHAQSKPERPPSIDRCHTRARSEPEWTSANGASVSGAPQEQTERAHRECFLGTGLRSVSSISDLQCGQGRHACVSPRCLRVQLKGSNVSVVELAPPGVETKLFRGEFAREMKDQKRNACRCSRVQGHRWYRSGQDGDSPPASATYFTC